MGNKAKRPLVKYFYKEVAGGHSVKFWRGATEEYMNRIVPNRIVSPIWLSYKADGKFIDMIKKLEIDSGDSFRLLYCQDIKDYLEERLVKNFQDATLFTDLYNFNVRIKIRGRHENQRSRLQRAM